MTSFPEHPPAFPPVPLSEWLEHVERELGTSSIESLQTATEDGLAIAPLYTAGNETAPVVFPGQPGRFPFVRDGQSREQTGWDIRVLRDEPDPVACASAAREDLSGGASSILLRTVGSGAPAGPGVRIASLDDLDAALNGVHLEMISVSLDAGVDFLPAAATLVALWERRETPLAARRGELGGDPLAALARHGTLPSSASGALAQLADLAAWTSRNLPGVRAVRVSTLPCHEAGCSPAQELGVALATGVCYLRALTDAGMSPREAASQLVFDVCVGTEQFQEMARLRALRLAWSRVLEECGVSGEAPVINAHMAPRVLTRRDPAVNMLRGTVACLTAAAAGAHSVTILPFDAAVGIPGALARRIARNTHHVIGEEAGLVNFADPAGGSWFVESLTRRFAELAWRELQMIEGGGGMVEDLSSGRLARRIAEARYRRAHAVATRARPITGVSEFAYGEEELLQRTSYTEASDALGAREPSTSAHVSRASDAESLDAAGQRRTVQQQGSMTAAAIPAIGAGATFSDVNSALADGEPASVAPLGLHRVADPFEALRDRSDAILTRTGRRPRVFVATLGTRAGLSARTAFTVNALAAGGIEPVMSAGSSDASATDAGSEFAASGCRIAVIAAAEDVPADVVARTAGTLRESGASLLIHAGRAGAHEASLREAGVSEFLYTGCDLVELLGSMYLVLEREW